MNKTKSLNILYLLYEIIPSPKCELDYSNNFELLCAVLLSAQTTDKRVNLVTKELFNKYPTPKDMMNAKFDHLYSIISQVGLAKTKTQHLLGLAKVIHEKYNDIVPSDFEELISLPGVGRKTASVVQAVGFKIPAFPVDTHLYRMAKRFGYINENQTVLDAEYSFKKYIPKEKWIDAHHLFLLFGRYNCKAKNPLCDNCKLKTYCKNKRNL